MLFIYIRILVLYIFLQCFNNVLKMSKNVLTANRENEFCDHKQLFLMKRFLGFFSYSIR